MHEVMSYHEEADVCKTVCSSIVGQKKISHFRGFIRQGINFYKDVTFFLNNTINNRVRSVE